MRGPSDLSRLLEHPSIWRGRSVAQTEVHPTGFGALDERLPGKGWPRSGLIEILVARFGVGELSLLLPALAVVTAQPLARWCVWVDPPMEPFAPALAAQGITLRRILVVRTPPAARVSRPGRTPRKVHPGHRALWAFEQSLASGACDAALAWVEKPRAQEIRRLQLAAERGHTLGVLFRPREMARESSHATLRMALEPVAQGVRVSLLKSRGGARGSVDLKWQTGGVGP